MKSQTNFLERRKRPRVGVIAQLEDITYRICVSTARRGKEADAEAFLKSAQPLARWMKKGPFCGRLTGKETLIAGGNSVSPSRCHFL